MGYVSKIIFKNKQLSYITLLIIVFDNLVSNCARDFGNKNGVNQDYLFALGILF